MEMDQKKDYWEAWTSTHGLMGQVTWQEAQEKREQAAIALQSGVRMFLERRRFLRMRRAMVQAATTIQSNRRMVVERRRFLKNRAAITLQRNWRMIRERRKYLEIVTHMRHMVLVHAQIRDYQKNKKELEEGVKDATEVTEEGGQKKGEEKPLGERERIMPDTGREPVAQTFVRHNVKKPSKGIPIPLKKVWKGFKGLFQKGTSSADGENKAAKEVEEKAKREAEEGGKRREERGDKDLAQEEMRAGPSGRRQLRVSPGHHPSKPDK